MLLMVPIRYPRIGLVAYKLESEHLTSILYYMYAYYRRHWQQHQLQPLPLVLRQGIRELQP